MKFLRIQNESTRPIIDIISARDMRDSDYCLLTFEENSNIHYFAGYDEDQNVIKMVLDDKNIINEEINEDSLKTLKPTKRYSLFGNKNLLPFSVTGQ
ncbi:MAG TPA: hypothetical protein VJ765_10665 [Chitinophagaceae bacterium]|nr:hypothetical protein [Chitinophagaceae bacterium]